MNDAGPGRSRSGRWRFDLVEILENFRPEGAPGPDGGLTPGRSAVIQDEDGRLGRPRLANPDADRQFRNGPAGVSTRHPKGHGHGHTDDEGIYRLPIVQVEHNRRRAPESMMPVSVVETRLPFCCG
jgi:hypothetical protein